MSQPFLAEIRMFGFNFAPRGWAMCNGQILSISQNTALFSLLGTTYGGDGRVTFGLPNLQGSACMAAGQGNGLTDRFLGETGGTPTVTLHQQEMAMHSHGLDTSPVASLVGIPGPTVAIGRSRGLNGFQANTTGNIVQLAPNAVAPAGGSLPHNNLQPYLVMNFCIAMQGIFPPRS